MVGVDKPGQVIYKLMLWGLSAGVATGIYLATDMLDTQKRMSYTMQSIAVQIAQIEAKTSGSPEKISDLYSQISELKTDVAKIYILLDKPNMRQKNG